MLEARITQGYYFFWSHRTVCGIPVPQLWTKSTPPAVEAWSPSHWITREVQGSLRMGVGEALVNRCSGHRDLSGSKTTMGQSQLAMVRPEQAGELERTSGRVAQQLRDNRTLLSYWDHMPGGKGGRWLDGRCSANPDGDQKHPVLLKLTQQERDWPRLRLHTLCILWASLNHPAIPQDHFYLTIWVLHILHMLCFQL